MTSERLTPEIIRQQVGPTQVLSEYVVLDSVGSTNTYLKEQARGAVPGTVVVADYQTAGRGREGRSWVAPAGSSIHCSVLLYPDLPASDLYLVTAASALAVRDTVAQVVTEPPVLKWPNDVLIGGRKLCGILTETELRSGEPPRIVVGFGVNVYAAPPVDAVPNATCVADHASGEVSRPRLLYGILRVYDALLHRLYSGDGDMLWQAWRSSLYTLGREVEVRAPGGELRRGTAVGVARNGSLQLRTAGGKTVSVYAGDAIDPAP